MTNLSPNPATEVRTLSGIAQTVHKVADLLDGQPTRATDVERSKLSRSHEFVHFRSPDTEQFCRLSGNTSHRLPSGPLVALAIIPIPPSELLGF
jgi:hypothetical protein